MFRRQRLIRVAPEVPVSTGEPTKPVQYRPQLLGARIILALQETPSSARQLAKQLGTSERHLRKVCQLFETEGLIHTRSVASRSGPPTLYYFRSRSVQESP